MDYPSGWLLRMKQYPRRTYEQFDAFEREFAHMGEGITHYTAFGNFDRVEFVPIYRFGDYQDKITSDSSWFGKQQPILFIYTEGMWAEVGVPDGKDERPGAAGGESRTSGMPLFCAYNGICFRHSKNEICGLS